MVKIISLVIAFFSCINAFGQENIEPKINKMIPEFRLDEITNYSISSATRNDFKGKWLILDFWTTTCASCIQSFPKVNTYYKEFRDKLTWVMVGKNDTKFNSGIKGLYEKLRKNQKLEMPSAYDSVLASKWNIPSYPHIIIIDPSGITRFITSGRDMSATKLRDLLDGKNVQFYSKENKFVEFEPDHIEYMKDKSMYRSIFTKWNGEKQHSGFDIDRFVDEKVYLRQGYNFSMLPLFMLYNYAYFGRAHWDAGNPSLFGKVFPRPFLEIKDSTPFEHDFNFNVGQGTYNYSLSVPVKDVSKERIMHLMQEDLNRYLGYVAAVETRNMPVWKLVAITPWALDSLKTKGGEQYWSPGSQAAGYTCRNVPAPYLVGGISFYFDEKYPNQPFIDATGLTGNFDFSIEGDMTDMKDVRKQLQKKGLDLVSGEEAMKVLVIKDSKK